MTRLHRSILAGVCAVALGAGLAACGGSDNSSGSMTPAATGDGSAAHSATAPTGGTAAVGGSGNSSGGGGYGY